MAPLRLAIVTPRFWPLVGDTAAHAMQLAESLVALGHRPTILTPRWKRSWPEEMTIGIVPLVRLRGSPRGGWSTLRWMYSLAGWLRGATHQIDGVLVFGIKHEAFVALSVSQRRHLPTILMGGEHDLAWHRTATLGSRIAARCRESLAIVAPSEALAKALANDGFRPEAISTIPYTVTMPPLAGASAREAARNALAAANYDLVTTGNSYVALAVGRLDSDHRFGDLIRAWRIITARRSEARLWIVGDGPDRETLYRQVGDLDQRFRALLPGTFDCLDDLMQASDCLLIPAAHAVPPLALLAAQTHGLPVVAADSEAVRAYISHEDTGLLYPPGDIKALAGAVTAFIDHPGVAIRYGSTARATAQSRPTPHDEAQALLDLLNLQR